MPECIEEVNTDDLLAEIRKRTEVDNHSARALAGALKTKIENDGSLSTCHEVTDLLCAIEFDALLAAIRARKDEFTYLAEFVADLPSDNQCGSDMMAELAELWPLADDSELNLDHPFTQAAMRAAFHRDPLLLMGALRDLQEEAKRLGVTSAKSGELLARYV